MVRQRLSGDRTSPLEADYALCRAIQRRHGKSYYFATLFFPPDIRRAVFALYGFVRVPDQWVDCPDTADKAELAKRLDRYQAELMRALQGEPVDQPVLRAFAEVMRQYQIPIRYPLDFLQAMRMDLYRTRYETLDELQTYIWGSASVVGVMMCYIMRSTEAETLRLAAQMGTAMQMTNFLRDIGEDWQRGRIYLPQAELRAFGITESHFAEGRVDKPFVEMMRFQIERCRRWYAEAERGIVQLPREAQFAVLLGSRLYARILDAIERLHYDVFRHRAHTSRGEKLRLAWRTYLEWRRDWRRH
jgi:phytoene synthase